MFKPCLYIVIIFARLLRYISFVGFVSVVFIVPSIIPNSFEMPLYDLRGIVVDSQGNIYCGLQFYKRVQVYNPKGEFLYGILISTSGSFWIRITNDDQLEVAAVRGKKRFLFDKNGEQISITLYNPYNYLEEFSAKKEFSCYDPKRDITYKIKPIFNSMAFLGSHVVKVEASGKETIIISTPFLKRLGMGTFPALLVFSLSTIISFKFDKRFREKMIKVLRGESVPKIFLLQSKDSNNK